MLRTVVNRKTQRTQGSKRTQARGAFVIASPPMRPAHLMLLCSALFAMHCASSQSTSSTAPTAHHHRRHHDGGLAEQSDTDGAVAIDDASAVANPCANVARVPARLPDGGINPEACIGQCSLVHHDPAIVANTAGDAASSEAPPTGTADLRGIDMALRREARSLRGCYDSAVLNHPWLANQGGTVNVHFIIEPTGRVRGHPTASGIDEVPEVANCLESRIRYIVFPVPDGGPAEISLPFNFEGAS